MTIDKLSICRAICITLIPFLTLWYDWYYFKSLMIVLTSWAFYDLTDWFRYPAREMEEFYAKEKPEEIILPDLKIIDCHHHIFERLAVSSSKTKRMLFCFLIWLANRFFKIFLGKRETFFQWTYMPSEFEDEVYNCGHNIVKTVYVECTADHGDPQPHHMETVGETKKIQKFAEKYENDEKKLFAGIISYCDLTRGKDIAPCLDEHMKFKNFRGIRCAMAEYKGENHHKYRQELEVNWNSEKFYEGLKCIEDRDLIFEIWCCWPQIPDVIQMVKKFPNIQFVLDHVGGNCDFGFDETIFEKWQYNIESFKDLPNVTVKLGGLLMWDAGFGLHRKEIPSTSDEIVSLILPTIAHCINLFGVDRCMFESNFPMDKVSVSYRGLWNAFKKCCLELKLSKNDMKKLFHDNANRLYKLDKINS